MSAMRFFTSGRNSARAISAFRRATISFGIPGGPKAPYHTVIS
jgi:hypothetical protein